MTKLARTVVNITFGQTQTRFTVLSAHKVKFSHLFSVILTYLLDIFHYVTKLKNLELLKYFVAYVKKNS